MTRSEFSRRTRRDALKRADNQCEGTGSRYGLPEGVRCMNIPAEIDHDKTDKECRDLGIVSNTLENAVCLCRDCHKHKTRTDMGRIRKADRQRDKASGAMKPSRNPIPGSRASGIRKRMNGTVERW